MVEEMKAHIVSLMKKKIKENSDIKNINYTLEKQRYL